MWLDVMHPKHYKALYEIMKRAEPYSCGPMPYSSFERTMSGRQGYVIITKDGELAGCISFDNYTPGVDVTIHCFIDPEHHGRWALKRSFYKEIFDYLFCDTALLRVSGYSICGVSDKAGRFLERLGFKHEGKIRQGIKMPDGNVYDVNLYGLLKNERRW